MEQITVSELASEFELKNSVVISELKKIGVWVPSADTPVDPDIANRIRRRLQLMSELEQEEQARAEKAKEKKKPGTKARKTIKELGKPRKRAAKTEEQKETHPLAHSLKPRKGKASRYRKVEEEEEVKPEKTEVTIRDEPVIEKVEAHLTAETLEKAMQQPTAEDLEALERLKAQEAAAEAAALRKAQEEVAAEAAREAAAAEAVESVETAPVSAEEAAEEEAAEVQPEEEAEAVGEAGVKEVSEAPEAEVAPVPAKPEAKVVKEKAVPRPEKRRKKRKPAKEAEVKTAAAPPARKAQKTGEPFEVVLAETVNVRDLAEKLEVKSKDLLRELMNRGIMAGINQSLDQKIVEDLCLAFNAVPRFVSYEEAVIEEEAVEDRPEDQLTRAPVVTVMGHVDHGKTSLLDSIRKTRVAASEAGGITQHIGAYQVEVKGQSIVFIDTPGHEAFTLMRARGAQVTDIVILVVAADDGVMPQTTEAINHARAANVPIIVAINKIDKPEAQVDRVKRELAEQNLLAEDWGGDTVMVEVSAKEGTNLELLLEMIALVSDMLELKANPGLPATGVVLEARLDKGRGAVATLLVQNGTLRAGDNFIAGSASGKIRAMFDDRGNSVDEAGPSSAVEILGLQGVPQAGDNFQAVEDLSKARQIVEYRQEKQREKELSKSARVSLDDLYSQMKEGELKELPVVLKADTQGSVEVVRDTLEKLSGDKVKINVIHAGVGAVSESDVLLATASNAVVVGFNVRPERKAQEQAELEGIDIRLYTVIYELIDQIKLAMVGLLEPTLREAYLGRAEVRQTFRVPKAGTVAGCYIQDGLIKRNAEVRLLRDNVVIYQGKIDSLKRFKEDVNQVKSGYECGISISNFNDIKAGDVIEAFEKEEVQPEL